MTNIDTHAKIGIHYHADDVIVSIPLAGAVTRTWCQRYEACARAKDVPAQAHEMRSQIQIVLPTSTESGDVVRILDVARDLIAEADAVEQSPTTSGAPEAVIRQWWSSLQN
jgi:hypothetical protein